MGNAGERWETMGIHRYSQRNPTEFTVWYVFTASQHHSRWSIVVCGLTLTPRPSLSHGVYWCLWLTLTGMCVIYVLVASPAHSQEFLGFPSNPLFMSMNSHPFPWFPMIPMVPRNHVQERYVDIFMDSCPFLISNRYPNVSETLGNQPVLRYPVTKTPKAPHLTDQHWVSGYRGIGTGGSGYAVYGYYDISANRYPLRRLASSCCVTQ